MAANICESKSRILLPRELVITKDPVSNNLAAISRMPRQRMPINVAPRNSEQILTFVQLDFYDLQERFNIDIQVEINDIEQLILDAINSIRLSGIKMMSYSQIYQLITGNGNAQLKSSMHMYEIIDKAVDKFMYGRISINAKAEAEGFGKNIPTLDSPLINAKRLRNASVNGAAEAILYVYDVTPLYLYADSKNEVTRIPTLLLNVPIKRTVDVYKIQYFLVKRIEAIKYSGGRISNTIRFDGDKGIYAAADANFPAGQSLTVAQRKAQASIRKKVFSMLDYWSSEQIKYIRGYTKNSKGKGDKIVSISIQYSSGRKGYKQVRKGYKQVRKGYKSAQEKC